MHVGPGGKELSSNQGLRFKSLEPGKKKKKKNIGKVNPPNLTQISWDTKSLLNIKDSNRQKKKMI